MSLFPTPGLFPSLVPFLNSPVEADLIAPAPPISPPVSTTETETDLKPFIKWGSIAIAVIIILLIFFKLRKKK